MGHIKFQMDGCYLRDLIKKDTTIFNPVVELAHQGGEKFSPNIKTGDRESRMEISKDPGHSTATFSYPIDTDPDPVNGRLYMDDQFVFDREKKTLEKVHRSFRMNAGAAGSEDWAALYGKLNKMEDLKKDDPVVQKFFQDVVLKTPEPADVPEPPKTEPSSTPSPSSSPVPADSSTPSHNLLERVTTPPFPSEGKYAAAVDDTVSRFMKDLTSPAMIGSVLAGSAAFRLGEAGALKALSGLSRPWLRRSLATVAGLTLEAPAFEFSARGLSRLIRPAPSWDKTSVGQGILRNFFTFGALRGSHRLLSAGLPLILRGNGLFLGKWTAPVLSGGLSFLTLHGINEAERALHWRDGKSDYKLRLIDDAALTLQVGVISFLLGRIKPRSPEGGELSPAQANKKRTSRPPSIPPVIPPLTLDEKAPTFHDEIEGLNPKLEAQFRAGVRVIRNPNPEIKEYIFVDRGGAKMTTTTEPAAYRTFRLWRELARYETEGMPGILDEFKTYRKGPKEKAILEDPRVGPIERVRIGTQNFYIGPLVEVEVDNETTPVANGEDTGRSEGLHAFALTPVFERGEMGLRSTFFFKDPQNQWWQSLDNEKIFQPSQEILSYFLRLEDAGNPVHPLTQDELDLFKTGPN